MGEDVADNDADKSDGSSGESEEEDENCGSKENDEGDSGSTIPAKEAMGKSEEGSTSPRGENNKKETIDHSGDKISKEPEENAKNDGDGNSDLVRYLQLEKKNSKEEKSRKRKVREDSNDSSSMSLIELSSSDSQDSLKSEHEPEKKRKRTESDRDFKRLESMRPSSAMSGINLIEDGSSSCSRFATKDSLEDDRFKSIATTNSNDVIMEVEDSNDVSEVPSNPAREDVTNHVDDNAMDQVQNNADNVDLRENEKTDDCEADLRTKDSLQVIDNESNDISSLSNEPTQIQIGHVQSLQKHNDPDETLKDTESIDNEDDGNETLIQSDDINNLLEARCSVVCEIGDEAHATSQNVQESSDIETDNESLALFYDEKDSEGTEDIYKTPEIPNSHLSQEIQEVQEILEADDALCEDEGIENDQAEVKGSEEDQGIYEGEIDIFEHEIQEAV